MTRGIPNGPVLNIEIGSGLNSDGNDDGLRVPRRPRRRPRPRRRHARVPGELADRPLRPTSATSAPTSILDALESRRQRPLRCRSRSHQPRPRDLAESRRRDHSKGCSAPTAVSRSHSAIVGSLDEDDQWQFGALGLISYDNSWRNRERIERDVADPETLVENKQRTINQVSATGVVNLGLSYTDDHEIATSSFFLRNTEDETAISTRTNNNFQLADGRQLRDYDIRYEQRELAREPDSRPPRDRPRHAAELRACSTTTGSTA